LAFHYSISLDEVHNVFFNTITSMCFSTQLN
jgi:hypothetical protein